MDNSSSSSNEKIRISEKPTLRKDTFHEYEDSELTSNGQNFMQTPFIVRKGDNKKLSTVDSNGSESEEIQEKITKINSKLSFLHEHCKHHSSDLSILSFEINNLVLNKEKEFNELYQALSMLQMERELMQSNLEMSKNENRELRKKLSMVESDLEKKNFNLEKITEKRDSLQNSLETIQIEFSKRLMFESQTIKPVITPKSEEKKVSSEYTRKWTEEIGAHINALIKGFQDKIETTLKSQESKLTKLKAMIPNFHRAETESMISNDTLTLPKQKKIMIKFLLCFFQHLSLQKWNPSSQENISKMQQKFIKYNKRITESKSQEEILTSFCTLLSYLEAKLKLTIEKPFS